MKIKFTKAWCERMARQEIGADLSSIEAGGMPVASPSEAFRAGSPASMPLQAAHHRSRAQGTKVRARQGLEKL